MGASAPRKVCGERPGKAGGDENLEAPGADAARGGFTGPKEPGAVRSGDVARIERPPARGALLRRHRGLHRGTRPGEGIFRLPPEGGCDPPSSGETCILGVLSSQGPSVLSRTKKVRPLQSRVLCRGPGFIVMLHRDGHCFTVRLVEVSILE